MGQEVVGIRPSDMQDMLGGSTSEMRCDRANGSDAMMACTITNMYDMLGCSTL